MQGQPALGEGSCRQTRTQVHPLDPENTGQGQQSTNGKGTETTRHNRKVMSSSANGDSMSSSSWQVPGAWWKHRVPASGEGWLGKSPSFGEGGTLGARWPAGEGQPRQGPHAPPLDALGPRVAERPESQMDKGGSSTRGTRTPSLSLLSGSLVWPGFWVHVHHVFTSCHVCF